MKRSTALRSLSREHHHALTVAQRLRRADDPDEATSDFLEFWRADGEEHFRIEEAVLLPLWALLGKIDERAAAQLSREHLAIRSVALSLPSQKPSLETLHALGSDLAAHVRFEERELFPLIEEDLTAEDLDRLAQAVIEAESDR